MAKVLDRVVCTRSFEVKKHSQGVSDSSATSCSGMRVLDSVCWWQQEPKGYWLEKRHCKWSFTSLCGSPLTTTQKNRCGHARPKRFVFLPVWRLLQKCRPPVVNCWQSFKRLIQNHVLEPSLATQRSRCNTKHPTQNMFCHTDKVSCLKHDMQPTRQFIWLVCWHFMELCFKNWNTLFCTKNKHAALRKAKNQNSCVSTNVEFVSRLFFDSVGLMQNSKVWLIDSKLLELFPRPALWKQMENNFFLLVLTVLPVGHQPGKIAPTKIGGNFVFSADSFVIDWLISAGDDLLWMPVETQSVSAGTTDFVVRVDEKLWVGSWLFKNCNSLFFKQGTVFWRESFDHADWVALPDEAADWLEMDWCHGIE